MYLQDIRSPLISAFISDIQKLEILPKLIPYRGILSEVPLFLRRLGGGCGPSCLMAETALGGDI